jgi:hypothetical protein
MTEARIFHLAIFRSWDFRRNRAMPARYTDSMSEAAMEPMYADAQGRVFLVPVIDMKEDGTLVLPRDVLAALRVKGCETFTFEVDEEQGSVILYAVGSDDWLEDQLSGRVGSSGPARKAIEDEIDALMRAQ